jgi:hypothetical protein
LVQATAFGLDFLGYLYPQIHEMFSALYIGISM